MGGKFERLKKLSGNEAKVKRRFLNKKSEQKKCREMRKCMLEMTKISNEIVNICVSNYESFWEIALVA